MSLERQDRNYKVISLWRHDLGQGYGRSALVQPGLSFGISIVQLE